ncbi:hypothetical protein D3C87_1302190 [compost metagenome]
MIAEGPVQRTAWILPPRIAKPTITEPSALTLIAVALSIPAGTLSSCMPLELAVQRKGRNFVSV